MLTREDSHALQVIMQTLSGLGRGADRSSLPCLITLSASTNHFSRSEPWSLLATQALATRSAASFKERRWAAVSAGLEGFQFGWRSWAGTHLNESSTPRLRIAAVSVASAAPKRGIDGRFIIRITPDSHSRGFSILALRDPETYPDEGR